jgi:hypothetical protein
MTVCSTFKEELTKNKNLLEATIGIINGFLIKLIAQTSFVWQKAITGVLYANETTHT